MKNLLKSLFTPAEKPKTYLRMNVERMAFDSVSGRFLLFMHSVGPSASKTGLIAFEGLESEEAVVLPLVFHNKMFSGLLKGLGLKVKEIRLNSKENSPDSAECVVKKGLLKRKIKISLLHAIILGNEFGLNYEVAEEILDPMMVSINIEGEPVSSFMNNLNLQKILEDERFENEVIM
ncbi:MAG: hypothetical protein A2Y33_07730 [Spirochaetes bacterium GWF1_51_8]|nr:MAG: hypothetical protein A2Y33_07730 [Spirochaetes bacterium GWF1_51_8]